MKRWKALIMICIYVLVVNQQLTWKSTKKETFWCSFSSFFENERTNAANVLYFADLLLSFSFNQTNKSTDKQTNRQTDKYILLFYSWIDMPLCIHITTLLFALVSSHPLKLPPIKKFANQTSPSSSSLSSVSLSSWIVIVDVLYQ